MPGRRTARSGAQRPQPCNRAASDRSRWLALRPLRARSRGPASRHKARSHRVLRRACRLCSLRDSAAQRAERSPTGWCRRACRLCSLRDSAAQRAGRAPTGYWGAPGGLAPCATAQSKELGGRLPIPCMDYFPRPARSLVHCSPHTSRFSPQKSRPIAHPLTLNFLLSQEPPCSNPPDRATNA